MKGKRSLSALLGAALLVSAVLLSVSMARPVEKTGKTIAVFVPGIVSGSPVYEMLVSGAQKAVDNHSIKDFGPVTLTIIEAGTNQAEWPGKLTALCAEGKYDLIFSSNPALPDIIEPLTKQFPSQHFLVLDAYKDNVSTLATVQYNQRQQAFMAGYAAAMATTSDDLKFSNPQKKIALIAAQEYPVMNKIIFPAFAEGAKAFDTEVTVDFRLVGNWYDAAKGNELARALFNDGVDVILPIAGGASQGVIAAAKDLGFYISWFDSDGYTKAPGNVISSAMIMQEKMAEKILSDYIENKVEFGKAQFAGMEDGYVAFTAHEPLTNDPERAASLEQMYTSILEKVLVLESPVL